MFRYETFQSNAAEAPVMRRWILFALVASLLIHGGFVWWAYQKRMQGFLRPSDAPVVIPRVFKLKQVSIAKPDDSTEPLAKLQENANSKPKPIDVPSEKPVPSEVTMAPQIPDLSKEIMKEKPKAESAGRDLAALEAGSRTEMDKRLHGLDSAILKEGPRLPRQPVIATSGGRVGSGEGDMTNSVPGLKSLDEALAATGPLHSGDKAGMPGGALFEYDKYGLRPEAVEQLNKLGLLIEKNPKATFSIEGHTDSFGSPDYNLRLSEKRAEAVKIWLVENMHIAPERISTKGYGSARMLVEGATQDEQAPNRRVEIVVKTNRK